MPSHNGKARRNTLFRGVRRRSVPLAEREVSIIPPLDLSYYDGQSPDFVYQLLPRPLTRVLDIGCGTGKLGQRLKADGVEEVIGVEISSEAAEEARRYLDQVFVGDIEELDLLCPDGYFDAIVYSGVLEHLLDPYFELYRRRRLLREGGVVVALLPNVQHFSVIMELLAGRWTLQRAGQLDATHYRWFTLHEIQKMFAASGFAIETIQGHILQRHPPVYDELIRRLKPLGLLNPNFEQTSDVYIYTVRARKLEAWTPMRRDAAQNADQSERFTGERAMPFAPNMDPAIMAEHWARYRRAAPLVRGLTLDIACGAGYGSDLLAAEGADRGVKVIGGDIALEAVQYSQQHYQRPNLRFAQMDIRRLPFTDASVDTVVSFETLEHVVEGDRFLREVARVLRPEGQLILSTPLGGPSGNPHHHAYYQRGTFEAYLRQFFREVDLSYQRGERFFDESQSPAYSPHFTGEYAFAICRGPRRLQCGRTSIIILTHNRWDQTGRCLQSLFDHTRGDYEIIVVDNGSTDDTLMHLRRWADGHPNLCVIANRENKGFAAGNNQGLSIASGEYVVFLNNDTVVTEGWLEGLRSVLERHPKAGLVGPMSNYVSGPQLVRGPGYRRLDDLPEFARSWAEAHRGDVQRVARLVGFCLLARREVIDRIGGFDERFGPGNFEDDDLCIRAQLAGFEAYIARDVFIHHEGSQTFRAAHIDFREAMERNWEIFKAKWGLPPEVQLGQPYELTLRVRDPSQYYQPLPDLAHTHRVIGDGRWWAEADLDQPAAPQTEERGSDEQAAQEFIDDLLRPGRIAMEEGDYERAVEAFRSVAESYPELAAGHVALGSALMALERWSQAISALQRGAELAPDAAAVHNLLGVALFQSGDLTRAEEALQRAYRLDPSELQAGLNLIDLYRSQQRYAEATEVVNELLRRDRRQPEVLVSFGILCVELGDVEGVQMAVDRLRSVAPHHPALAQLEQAMALPT